MDNRILQAVLRTILHDQAYLYASMQALIWKYNQEIDCTEEQFNEWMDDFKEESAALIEKLAESIAVEDFMEDDDAPDS